MTLSWVAVKELELEDFEESRLRHSPAGITQTRYLLTPNSHYHTLSQSFRGSIMLKLQRKNSTAGEETA